jgi:hypothetical protein
MFFGGSNGSSALADLEDIARGSIDCFLEVDKVLCIRGSGVVDVIERSKGKGSTWSMVEEG